MLLSHSYAGERNSHEEDYYSMLPPLSSAISFHLYWEVKKVISNNSTVLLALSQHYLLEGRRALVLTKMYTHGLCISNSIKLNARAHGKNPKNIFIINIKINSYFYYFFIIEYYLLPFNITFTIKSEGNCLLFLCVVHKAGRSYQPYL